MSAVVRDLRPVSNDPYPEVVEILERALEYARKGEVVAVGVVTHHRGGGVGDAHHITPEGDGAHLVAGFERVKLRILRDNL